MDDVVVLFENRHEIEDVMLILNQFMEEHPKDDKVALAKRFFDRLEVLHMTW